MKILKKIIRRIKDWNNDNQGFWLMLLLAIITISFYCQQVKKEEPQFKCIDGDSFSVQGKGGIDFYRLAYIDTPEKGESGYQEALDYTCWGLIEILGSEEDVKFNITGEDIYKRYLVDIVYEDGSTLNENLIKEGLAIPFFTNTTDKILKLYEARSNH
jgi:endonuclease YncB( thermonuclease family)